MSSKKQTHRNDKTNSKQQLSKPATENSDKLSQQQPSPATIIQRAKLSANSLTPSNVLQLQRLIGNQAVGKLLSSTPHTPTIQRFLACYSRTDMNYQDDNQGNWNFETIGYVRYIREGGPMNYTLVDGSNTGSIKHYVPSNWISKNLIDNHITGKKRHEVITRLTAILNGLALPIPGHDTSRKDGFDAWVSDAVVSISDWEPNLFRDVPSSGDGRGTQLDTPTDQAVLNRVTNAQGILRRWGIGAAPLG